MWLSGMIFFGVFAFVAIAVSVVVVFLRRRVALRRIVIKVNASYKSDPDDVHRVLMQIATASELVKKRPPPVVTFDNLGADALEFSIRAQVTDVTKVASAEMQLRTAVVHAFRDLGLEFATAERDIYLRDLDGVKVMIARIIEERARAQAASGEVKPDPDGGATHASSEA